MRARWLIAAWTIAAPAAAETPRAETCRKGDDERRIEVVAPGKIGRACDVVYARASGADVKVPYHANMDANFCRARAAEMIALLSADGFTCSTAASASIEASLAGGPVAPEPTTTTAAIDASSVDVAADAQPPRQVVAQAAAPQSAPLNEQLEQLQQPSVAEAAPVPTTQELATSEPVQLASGAQPIEYRAPPPQRTAGVGRLVGPPPSLDDIVDESAGSVAQPSAPGADALPPRPAEDVIRNVLAAVAAAWNEGNLDAFLGGYAATDEIACIRNATVTAGFPEVRALYEQEITAAGEMGRLSFDTLDVKMTSNEAATVTGRYALQRAAGTAQGVMTLVMKQTEGRWRIVEDTRIADARP